MKMGKLGLEVLKQLEKRRRKKVQINKSMVDNIQYHADIRANIDRVNMSAERDRLQGLLGKTNLAMPMLIRHRYEELQKALA